MVHTPIESEQIMVQVEEKKTYHGNGQLDVHSFFLNDRRHGEYKDYYESGQLRTHCFLLNGKQHGEYKDYYESGQLRTHCFLLNGKYHGEYKDYCPDGQLALHRFYLNGNNITDEVTAQFGDEFSQEDQLLIKIKWGIPCLN